MRATIYPMKTTLTQKQLEEYMLAKPGTNLSYPFGEEAAVYKVNEKMFAIIAEGKDPARISLKCDPLLAEHLRQKYEEVQPGYHLNKKHWNTIVTSGQLSEQEIYDLINLSYDLVVKGMTKEEQDKLRAAEVQ